MPDRTRARLALTTLLVLLTVAGVRAVGPAIGVHLPGRGRIIAIGCALEAVLAVLLLALRWRRAGSVTHASAGAASRQAPGPASGTGPVRTPGSEGADIGARLRPILSGIIMTALVATPLATLIGAIGKWRNSRPFRVKLHVPTVGHGTFRAGRGHGWQFSLPIIIQDSLVALLIAGVVIAAIVIWRHRRPRMRPLDPGSDETPDAHAELGRAVDSGRAALRELDDARAAIIRCYLAMEGTMADAGAARAIAETPDELLARAAAAQLVNAAPAGRLTGLFYEARFSTHPMPSSRRDEAEQALSELAETLPAGTLSAETPPAGTGP